MTITRDQFTEPKFLHQIRPDLLENQLIEQEKEVQRQKEERKRREEEEKKQSR